MAVQHSSSPEKLHDKLQRLSDSALQDIVQKEQNNSYVATIALGILRGRQQLRDAVVAGSAEPNPPTVAAEVIAETGVPSLPVELDVPPEVASKIPRGINAARGAPTDTDRFMPEGVAGLPSPNMTYAAQGGIVSFAEGGSTKESVPSTPVLNAARKEREARRVWEILKKQEEDIEEDKLRRLGASEYLRQRGLRENYDGAYSLPPPKKKAQGGIVNLRSGGSLRWKEGLQPPDSIMDFWNRLLTYTGMGEDEEEERKAGERAAGTSRPPTTGDLRRAAEAERLTRSVIDEEAVPNTPSKEGRHPLFPATPGAKPRWKEGLGLNQIASLLEEERKAGERAAGTSPRATTGDLRREAERLGQLRSVIDEEAVPDTPPKKGRPTGPRKSGIARAAELLRKSKKAEREAEEMAVGAPPGATSDATPLSALNPNDPRLSLINRAVELFKPDQQQRVQQEAQAARLRELKEGTEIPVPEEDPLLDVLKPSPATTGDLRRGAKKTARARDEAIEKRNKALLEKWGQVPLASGWFGGQQLPASGGEPGRFGSKIAEVVARTKAEAEAKDQLAGEKFSTQPVFAEPEPAVSGKLRPSGIASVVASAQKEAEAARAREPKPKPKPKSPEPKPPVAGARAEVGAKKATEQTTQIEQEYSDINLVTKGTERLNNASSKERDRIKANAEAKGISPIRLALILGGLKLMSGESLGDAAEKAVAAYAAAEKYQYDRSAKAYEKARRAEDRWRTAKYREEMLKIRKEEGENRQARAEATAENRAETSAIQKRELELAEQKAQRERAEDVDVGVFKRTFEEAAWGQIYRKFPNARPENLRREKALENAIPGLVSAMERAYIRTGRLPGGPDPIKRIQLLPQRMP